MSFLLRRAQFDNFAQTPLVERVVVLEGGVKSAWCKRFARFKNVKRGV